MRTLFRIWRVLTILWMLAVFALTALFEHYAIRQGDLSGLTFAFAIAMAPPALIFLLVWGAAKLFRAELGLDGEAPHAAVEAARRANVATIAGRLYALSLACGVAGVAGFVYFAACRTGWGVACPHDALDRLTAILHPIPAGLQLYLIGAVLLAPAAILDVIARNSAAA